MAETIQLRIVTPERLVVEDAAQQVQVPAKNGELGILPGHAPLITELAVGEIAYRPVANGGMKRLAVAWGFAEVLPDRVTILAETAERAEDIDVARATRARARAEERLAKPSGEAIDFQRCQTALQRAQVR